MEGLKVQLALLIERENGQGVKWVLPDLRSWMLSCLLHAVQGILYVDRMWPTTLAATENLPQWARAIPAGVMGRCTCHHPVDRLWQPGHPTPMPVTTLTDTSTTTATTSPVKGSG
ncbi:hypothetical protein Vafri_978 [Volvox africanus]|nr:hypothetical protein Vafri_978 [Volvox africanus]